MQRGRISSTMIFLLTAWAVVPVAFAQDLSFGIQTYRIQGASLVPLPELTAAVAPYRGDKRVYGDVQRAVEAVEAIYRTRGYTAVTVYIPEQDITQGVVEIRVLEALVGKVSVKGAEQHSEANVRASLPALREGVTPNTRQLSENVQLANSNPSKRVDVVLGVGSVEGVVDATVNVDDQAPLRAVITLDNTGTKESGRHRISFAVQHANLWDRDHVGTLSYGTSVEEPSQLRSVSASYRVPFYAWGDSLDLIVGDSRINTSPQSGGLSPVDFTGAGTVLAARYTWNFPRRGEYSSRVVLGAEYKSFDNACSVSGAPIPATAGCTDLMVRPVSLSYGGQQQGVARLIDYSLGLTANLPGGSNGDDAAFASAQPGAKAAFSLLRANASVLKAFASQWQGRAALGLQFTGGTLVGAERFGLVGSSAVRGFDERVVAADSGAVVNLEALSPDVADRLGVAEWLGGFALRGVGFLDGGWGKNDTGSAEKVSSWGLGLRAEQGRHLSARLDVANVLAGGPVGTAQKGDWRAHFSIVAAF